MEEHAREGRSEVASLRAEAKAAVSTHPLLDLQRMAGNRAVQQMIQRLSVQRIDPPDAQPGDNPIPSQVTDAPGWGPANDNVTTGPFGYAETIADEARAIGGRVPRSLATGGRIAQGVSRATAPLNVIGGAGDTIAAGRRLHRAWRRGDTGGAVQAGADQAAATANTASAVITSTTMAAETGLISSGGGLATGAAALGPAAAVLGAGAFGYAVGQNLIGPALEAAGVTPAASRTDPPEARGTGQDGPVHLPSVSGRLHTPAARNLALNIESLDRMSLSTSAVLTNAYQAAINRAAAATPADEFSDVPVRVVVPASDNLPAGWQGTISSIEVPVLLRILELSVTQRDARRRAEDRR